MRKPAFWNAMSKVLQNKGKKASADYCQPKWIQQIYLHKLARNPKKTAKRAVEIIGTPGTKYGVIASANAQAATASARSVLLIKRGQRRPKNAAGTAASSPHAAGLPIACAPKAPAKVKIFQNIKTPIPVNQNPCRASLAPKCS